MVHDAHVTTDTKEKFQTKLEKAFPPPSLKPDRAVRLDLFRQLHAYYLDYMQSPVGYKDIPLLNTNPEITALENAWMSWEDSQVDHSSLPETAGEFKDWFLAVSDAHTQPDFCHYLAKEANLREIAYFFMAEELVDGKFDDLMAMAQIGTVGETKLTIAENYWDEMGEGKLEDMHTRLFERSARHMRKVLADSGVDNSSLYCTEVYENASILLMYGIYRHLNPRGLGAMGVLEQSASPRFQAMVDACTRLQVPDHVVHYQQIHVHVDASHGEEWNKGVFTPLVGHSNELMREIALGIATRIRIAEAYYREIWNQMKTVRG